MRNCESEAIQLLRKIGRNRGFRRQFSLICQIANGADSPAARRAWRDLEELLAIDLEKK